MKSREEQLWLEFEGKADELSERYRKEMEKLKNIPKAVPEHQQEKDGIHIVESIESKMAELGRQFKQQMSALADDFIAKISEMGDKLK